MYSSGKYLSLQVASVTDSELWFRQRHKEMVFERNGDGKLMFTLYDDYNDSNGASTFTLSEDQSAALMTWLNGIDLRK